MEENKEIKAAVEPAFKDFKSAVSKEEFEAVLASAESEYFRIKKALDSREKVASAALNPPEGMDNMPPGLLKKLAEGFLRKANKDLVITFSEELNRGNTIVDFINRFRQTNDQLDYHDLSFIKKMRK